MMAAPMSVIQQRDCATRERPSMQVNENDADRHFAVGDPG
jgi:hypothetical protein